MIEFRGELSANSKKHIRKHDNKLSIISGLFVDVILVLPVSICVMPTIFGKGFPLPWILLVLACLIAIILLFPFANVKSKKKFASILPQSITIDEENIITLHRKVNPLTRSVESVKDVRDYGDFYDINFALIGTTGLFVCQKDLMTQGSIEEFEALFKGKIIRVKSK